MVARSKSSNQRPDTLMQDRKPTARRKPLATRGRTIHWGQNRKSSMRAYVFWFASDSGHRQLTNDLPYPSFAETLLARRWVDFAAWLYRPNVGGKSSAVTCRTFDLCPNFVRFRGGLLHSNHFFEMKSHITDRDKMEVAELGVHPRLN